MGDDDAEEAVRRDGARSILRRGGSRVEPASDEQEVAQALVRAHAGVERHKRGREAHTILVYLFIYFCVLRFAFLRLLPASLVVVYVWDWAAAFLLLVVAGVLELVRQTRCVCVCGREGGCCSHGRVRRLRRGVAFGGTGRYQSSLPGVLRCVCVCVCGEGGASHLLSVIGLSGMLERSHVWGHKTLLRAQLLIVLLRVWYMALGCLSRVGFIQSSLCSSIHMGFCCRSHTCWCFPALNVGIAKTKMHMAGCEPVTCRLLI